MVDHLSRVNADPEECMNFMQHYLDLTDFSELELVGYVFDDMKYNYLYYFYENNEDDPLFHICRVNFIKLIKLIIANAGKFKDNVLSNLTIFLLAYAYTQKLTTKLG